MLKHNNTTKLIILILLITHGVGLAQNSNTIDSLKNIIAETKEDTTIIHAYLDLSLEYQDINLDTALYYSDQALKKSLKIKYKKGIADSYKLKGEIVTYLNNYKLADSLLNTASSIYKEINQPRGIMQCYIKLSVNAYYKGENHLILKYCMKALKIAENNSFIEDKAKIFNNIGIAYINMGDYDNAIKNGLLALRLYEQFNNKKMIASCNVNIGVLFMQINNFDKSLQYMNKALELFIELDDTRNQSVCLKNIGIVYTNQNKYDEALQNFNKTLQLNKENKDLTETSADYTNIGNIYYKLEKYNTAAEYYNKSLKISGQIGDNRGIAICYFNIARLNVKLKNYTLAEDYCLKSTELFEQNNELDKQQESLEHLAIIYKQTKEYQKAYNTYFKAVAIKDSLLNIEKIQKITQLEERYLNEKLEKQNLTLIYENEIQQSKINYHIKTHKIYFTGLFLTLIAISIILIQYKKKNNAYKFLVQKNIELLDKEKEVKIVKKKIAVNEPNNNRKITITDNLKEIILEKLTQMLDNEKTYRDFDLTIDKLAKNISTNRNYLSQTIYKEYRKSYSDFINEYRVKEAILLLSDPKKNSELSIAGISKETGFRSVPCFNSAFKKYAGITPSEFRTKVNVLNINNKNL